MQKKASTPSNVTWIVIFVVFAVIAAAVLYAISISDLGSSGTLIQDLGLSAKEKSEEAIEQGIILDFDMHLQNSNAYKKLVYLSKSFS